MPEPGSDDLTMLTEVGYYYPEAFWSAGESEWVKTLLLFFDQVAILLPEYMYGRHRLADPTVTEPLEDRGLLRVLQPESFVDKEVTDALMEAMAYLLETGTFDHLERDVYFAELSRSRLGWSADVELSGLLVDELKTRGLAKDSEDGVSVPLHPTVRTVVLVLLSQLSRSAGKRQGLDLHPITHQEKRIRNLIATLKLADVPRAGEVITLDLETVTVNLEDVRWTTSSASATSTARMQGRSAQDPLRVERRAR